MNVINTLTKLKKLGYHCSLQTHTNGCDFDPEGMPMFSESLKNKWLVSIEDETGYDPKYAEGIADTPEDAMTDALWHWNDQYKEKI